MEENIKLSLVIVDYLTNKLRLTTKEKLELFYFISQITDGFCIGDLNANFDIFIDHCKYKMKSSDKPLIRRISKQLEIREKIEQINSDFK